MPNKYSGGYQIIDLSALNGKNYAEAVVIPGIYKKIINSDKPIRFTMTGTDLNESISNQVLLNAKIIISTVPDDTIFIAIDMWDPGTHSYSPSWYITIGDDNVVELVEA